MDKLGALESFVSAVQSGSLSGAARRRGLSQPAVSQQISALEAEFGTKLLRRGRGGVRMTEAGELVYVHAQAMIGENAALLAGLEAMGDLVEGRLVVTANLGLSQHVLSEVIVGMKRRHPALEIVLRADIRVLDPATEGIDIALRCGVGSGGGVLRKIATLANVLVATPEYLDSAGRPETPEDLVNLDYIQFTSGDDQIATTLIRDDRVIQAPIRVGFTAQHPDLIDKALFGHLGYAKVPVFAIGDTLQQGRLERVLPGIEVPATELFLVFPGRERRRHKELAFLEALFDHLEKAPGIDLLPSARQIVSEG